MKKSLLLIFSAASFLCSNGQWQKTNLTNVSYLPIASIASHNGQLYGTVSNGFGFQAYKLDGGGTSWSTFTPGNLTNVRDIVSADTRMYAATLTSGVISMVYYSTDNGASFTVDTAGIPKFSSGVATLTGFIYYKGKLLANAGSYGYYLKDTTETRWRLVDVATKMNGGADPMTIMNDTMYAYDNTGTNSFYVSSDWGTTWTAVAKDLPADFQCKYLATDGSIGRIFASGVYSQSTMTGIYYSDNQGVNWTKAGTGLLIHKSANNQPQQVTMLYADGGKLYAGLENDKDQTVPNLISSSNGGVSFVADSAGMPVAASAVSPWKMIQHQGKQVLALNVMDVFTRAGGNSISETQKQSTTLLYPNPVADELFVKTESGANKLKVLDLNGRVILESELSGSLDVSSLPLGYYLIQLSKNQQYLETKTFIKN